MQTFLPYPDFKESAKCLDYRRLGKQRVEAWQIYLALIQPNYGWKNHPAVKMWKGYEQALLEYGLVMCYEWIERGYKDTLRFKFLEKQSKYLEYPFKYPEWYIHINHDFYASHRSNLLRKDPKWYGQYGWKEPNNLPYIWLV